VTASSVGPSTHFIKNNNNARFKQRHGHSAAIKMTLFTHDAIQCHSLHVLTSYLFTAHNARVVEAGRVVGRRCRRQTERQKKISKLNSIGRRRREPAQDQVSTTRFALKCMHDGNGGQQKQTSRQRDCHHGNDCPVAAASRLCERGPCCRLFVGFCEHSLTDSCSAASDKIAEILEMVLWILDNNKTDFAKNCTKYDLFYYLFC